MSYSLRLAEAVTLSLELAGGVGGGAHVIAALQVGVGVGMTTLPSALQGATKDFPRLVTCPVKKTYLYLFMLDSSVKMAKQRKETTF